jgi:hypothetical protein
LCRGGAGAQSHGYLGAAGQVGLQEPTQVMEASGFVPVAGLLGK